jgi:hypothetical protein
VKFQSLFDLFNRDTQKYLEMKSAFYVHSNVIFIGRTSSNVLKNSNHYIYRRLLIVEILRFNDYGGGGYGGGGRQPYFDDAYAGRGAYFNDGGFDDGGYSHRRHPVAF